jgi:hypothetical protein
MPFVRFLNCVCSRRRWLVAIQSGFLYLSLQNSQGSYDLALVDRLWRPLPTGNGVRSSARELLTSDNQQVQWLAESPTAGYSRPE